MYAVPIPISFQTRVIFIVTVATTRSVIVMVPAWRTIVCNAISIGRTTIFSM